MSHEVSLMERIKFMDKLKLAWCFDRWEEKLTLVVLVNLGIYALIRIIVQGLW